MTDLTHNNDATVAGAVDGDPAGSAAITPSDAYMKWQANPGPETMSGLLKELDPVITSEAARYQGPSSVLRSRARNLAVKAVRSYDPQRGASLRTWVTSNLRPLSRYSQRISVVRDPEVARRRASELYSRTTELTGELGRTPTDTEIADHVGLPVRTVHDLRTKFNTVISDSQMFRDEESGSVASPVIRMQDSVGMAEDLIYSGFTDREKMVFDMKTGRKGRVMQNAEIAAALGISPAAVSQMTANMARRIMEVERAID